MSSSGQSRPVDSGRKDSLGRTVRVGAGETIGRADAPVPPLELTEEMAEAVHDGPQVLMSRADLDRVRGVLTDEQREALSDVSVIPVEIEIEPDDDGGWEAVEPDESDYAVAVEDAIRFAGLERAGVKAGWWDADGSSDAMIGLKGRAGIGDLESDYFTSEVADEYASMMAAHPDLSGRELSFATYSQHRHMASATSQFVSVPLTSDELDTVYDYVDRHYADDLDFAWNRIRYWSAGDPKEMQACFGFVSPHDEWQRMSRVVGEALPHIGAALSFGDCLVADANRTFGADCDHIGSDEWKQDEYELRNMS